MPEVLGAAQKKSATITAQDSWAGPMLIHGWFDVSIGGVTGTTSSVSVQRSFDGGVTWGTVIAYTVDQQDTGFAPSSALYRIGVATGAYVAGTILVTIAQ